MAINAYVGVPGSGKSYEVVKSVILPAFLSGRRIVTNIEGVKEQNFIDYAVNKLKSNPDDLGSIVKVNDSDVLRDNFFPFKGCGENETIAKFGDLICIDEVWRIFDENVEITDHQKSFVAEHRHFVNEKGHTCDLVVINQSVSNIPKFIKDRIEQTYSIFKLKALGLNTRYRVDVYVTAKLIKRNFISQYQEKYNSDIFNLYSSYDNKNAKELVIDKRGNIFASKFFIFKFVFAFLILIFSFSYFYFKYFAINEVSDSVEVEVKDKRTEPKDNLSENKEVKKNKSSAKQENFKKVDDFENYKISSEWRIVGEYKSNGLRVYILTDRQGNIRREPASSLFKGKGGFVVGVVDGSKVSYYSGKGETNDLFREKTY